MRYALLYCLIVVMSNLAVAPTTWPTTRPAKVDLSSPESAFWSYVDAVEQGDLAAHEKIVAPQNDDERRALSKTLSIELAAQRLQKMTQTQLGNAVAAQVEEMMGNVGLGPSKESGKSLREAKEANAWKINRDDAVLGEVWPEIRFRRINGRWRLMMPLDDKGDALEQQLERMAEFNAMLETITQRIETGELATKEQIGRAIAGLMPVVTVEGTTQPATTTKP